jgi:hypothetical protein
MPTRLWLSLPAYWGLPGSQSPRILLVVHPPKDRLTLSEADLPTVQTSSKIMFRRGLKTVKTSTQMCEI